jgi:transposase
VPEARPERARVLALALAGALSTAEAARQLGLSVRQVRRLKDALATRGTAGLVHGNRGRRSPRRVPDELRERVVELARTVYIGSDQTRLRALLAERDGIALARSTLRRILLEAGLHSPTRRQPPRLPAATLPIALDLARRRVTLLDLQGADFRELSFQQTLERRRRERPDALRFELDLDAFAAAARAAPGRAPDGFLFSVGPYDATPLAEVLSAPDEHLVIKESPFVNALLMGLFAAGSGARRRELEALTALTLPSLFRPTRGTERRLLLKFSSWNLRAADALLRRFPKVPAAILYRPADETVAGMLARPPGWQDLLGQPRAAQVRFFPTLAAVPPDRPLSPAAFYAHSWRSGIEHALALPGGRVLMLEHRELVADPAGTLRRLAVHFRLSADLAAAASARGLWTEPLQKRPVLAALDPQQQAEVSAVVGELSSRLPPARA